MGSTPLQEEELNGIDWDALRSRALTFQTIVHSGIFTPLRPMQSYSGSCLSPQSMVWLLARLGILKQTWVKIFSQKT